MARRKKHEEHLNHESWAIPYGDLVTLLFALFTVMYAMSSVNEGKYRVLSDALVAAFRGAPRTDTPITLTKDSSGKGGSTRMAALAPTTLMKLKDPRPVTDTGKDAKAGAAGEGPIPRHGPDPRQALITMAEAVRKALQDLIDRRLVNVRQTALTLEVEIKTDVLFPSGVARVQPAAVPVLDKVAAILKPFPNAIRVEGHTDNRPINTTTFPSNWELSAARAANVVQLFTRDGVDPARMEVLGLGEQRPVAGNDSATGRNANRRVVIVVMQSAGEDGRDAVEKAAAADAGVSGQADPAVPPRPAGAAVDPAAASSSKEGV